MYRRSPSLPALGLLGFLGLVITACSEGGSDPNGRLVASPLRVQGQLSLTGVHDRAAGGGVLLRLVEQESGRVLLQRIYDLQDPAWDRSEGRSFLYYALTPDFAFDAAPPIHAPLALEVIHLPPGVAAVPSPSVERLSRAIDLDGREQDLTLHLPAAVASGTPKGPPTAPR